MHSYLRAIGFSSTLTDEREIELLLDNLIHTFDDRKVIGDEQKPKAYIEITKSFGPNIGICVLGEMDSYGFHRQSYFPYMLPTGITSHEETALEAKIDGNGYYAMIDEKRVGISVIFTALNVSACREVYNKPWLRQGRPTASLSALSNQGMVLLPLQGNTSENREERQEYYAHHESLVGQARNGNQEAVEMLTMEDMDTFAMIARRIQHEDVLSIVDTYMMPYGMESDQYQIVGEITFYTKVRNLLTREYMIQMTVCCNGMMIDLCINEKDLLGDPEVGRRFKGNIWLQGTVAWQPA